MQHHKMSNIKIFCLIFASALTNVESARILGVFPSPSISHHVVFRPITQELARRGHEVTVITADPAFPKGQTPNNLREIDVHDITYAGMAEKLAATATGRKEDLVWQMEEGLKEITEKIEKQLQNKETQDMIKTKTFDLLLIEAWTRPALLYSHIFKVPVILISSFGQHFRNYETVGGVSHPLVFPSQLQQKTFNYSTWDKIQQLNIYARIQKFLYEHEAEENKMIRRNLGPDVPSLSELSNNVDMLFLNTHRIWEGNYPVPPAVIHMGGLHVNPQKELPQDLKKFLDESKHGVIYMSFGTNKKPSSMPAEKIKIFVEIFSQLPYDILWKWDKDELPGRSKNIRIQKWFPQSDILRHPKVKLFITQGGLQSTDEAITAGVPLIGVPMLADQWFNVDKYVYHKIGLQLDVETFTAEELKEKIKTVINDESFRKNIVKLRNIIEDEPMKPLERTIWWIEYVIRHKGAKHLRSPAANMSLIDYYEIPLVSGILATLVVMILLVVLVLRYFYNNFVSSNKIKDE